MKTIKLNIKTIIVSLLLFSFSTNTIAQTSNQKSLTVFHIDSKGINLDPEQIGNLARIEIGKLGLFEVMDKYDVQYIVDKNKLDITNCYGKLCLVDVGKTIGVDKVLSGSVELYGETIIITLRLIDVKTNSTEKTQIKEFLNLQNDIQSMIHLTLCEMFSLEKNTILEERLTNKFGYDNLTNNPNENNLNLSGPRMGFTYFTGKTAEVLQSSKADGGYDAYPAMFQFGYQFETQYLNEGNFQALFEFIPMITGLDQGYVLPSFTIMNGLRNNLNGFEIAFGPNIFLSRESTGYYRGSKWYSEYDYDDSTLPTPEMETRLHSSGDLKVNSAFIIAIGKTFVSGKLNIPVNAYIVPSKNGFRYGLSFGYNAKK